MSEAQLLEDKNGNSSQKEEETSIEENEELRGPNLTAFFVAEQKEAPLKASDNKILFRYSSEFIKYWQIMVIILAMYNSVTIPIAIFYDD